MNKIMSDKYHHEGHYHIFFFYLFLQNLFIYFECLIGFDKENLILLSMKDEKLIVDTVRYGNLKEI